MWKKWVGIIFVRMCVPMCSQYGTDSWHMVAFIEDMVVERVTTKMRNYELILFEFQLSDRVHRSPRHRLRQIKWIIVRSRHVCVSLWCIDSPLASSSSYLKKKTKKNDFDLYAHNILIWFSCDEWTDFHSAAFIHTPREARLTQTRNRRIDRAPSNAPDDISLLIRLIIFIHKKREEFSVDVAVVWIFVRCACVSVQSYLYAVGRRCRFFFFLSHYNV